MEKLTLKDVQLFGGSKEDPELLKGVDESEGDDLAFSDGEVDNDSKDEIKTFIEKLGLRSKHSTSEPSKDKTKIGAETKNAKDQPTRSAKSGKKRTKQAVIKNAVKNGKIRAELTRDGGVRSVQLDKDLLALSAKAYKKLLVSMDSDQLLFEQSNSTGAADPVSPQALNHLTKVGEELMQAEIVLYERVRQKRKSNGDLKWLKTVLSSGTLSDKMAARTLLIQESPLHTSNSLDSLLTMASKKGKRECVFAVDTLKELWLTDLLPGNRKLKSLKQRPLSELVSSGQSVQSQHTKLLLWYYEDQVKTKYAQFIAALKGLLHDTVANIREKMLGHTFDLLYQKPEQEQELLSQIVNKMGDPVRKIASKASLFVLKLLNQHVNMKVVVASELERLLHRPNIRSKAQYYCVCCLNQFTIGGNDDVLAAKLIDIYFTFFKLYVKRGELDAKMLGALLTGVNRAFPFMKGDIPMFEDHMQSLFTVVHVGPLATGIQSLLLLYQVMESRQAISGRYYQALYTKLMDPALKHSGKQGVFLNLLFKSLKSDPEISRVKAFIKRILQISAHHSPAFLCGCLYLISELLKLKSTLWSFILQPEASDNEHFVDTPLQHVSEQTLTPEQATVNADSDEERQEDGSDNRMMSSPGHLTRECGHVTRTPLYKMICRNPLYCGAETSCLWELSRLMFHYHPSVQVFANKIASGEYIDYKGDPLQDFTAMHFLDRFVYKNPKQKESDHGGSLMQKTSRLLSEESKKAVPVNSAQFVSLRVDKVRVDEMFMHKYFVQKSSLEQKATKETVAMSEADLPANDEDELDFASELEKQVSGRRQPKKRKGRDESDSEGEGGSDIDGIDSDIELDNESLVGDVGVASGGNDATEAEMERLLLEQLSSESDGEDGRPQRKKKKSGEAGSGQLDVSSMFAAAEEFSHILEDADGVKEIGSSQNGRHKKQLLWEQKNSGYRKVKGRDNVRNRTAKKSFKVKQKRNIH